MTIQTIIFDIGGVLLRVQEDGEYYHIVMQRLGLDRGLGTLFKNELKKSREEFSKGKITDGEFYSSVLSAAERAGHHIKASQQEFYRHWNEALFLGPNESMIELAEHLGEKGYQLQILGNISRPHLDFVKKNYPYVFAFMDNVVASCEPEVGVLKGDGLRIYDVAYMNNRAEKPSDCIFIDDKLRNAWEAYQYGFSAFHSDLSEWSYEQATEKFERYLKALKVLD